MESEVYNGWVITFSENAPVTGKWRAERDGVGLCTNTREGLLKMIDAKNKQRLGSPTWRNDK